MPIRLNILILFLHLFFSSCQSDTDTDRNSKVQESTFEYKPLVIKTGIENGHPAGIRIAIATTKDYDSSTAYKLLSSFQGLPVGFLIVLPRKGNGKKNLNICYLKSLGAPSDLFLTILAHQYGQKIESGVTMKDSIPFICMDLNSLYGSDESPKAGDYIAAQYKLFFDSEKEEGDAELFMNIIAGQWIEFAEKDEEYRSHLIRLFTNKQ